MQNSRCQFVFALTLVFLTAVLPSIVLAQDNNQSNSTSAERQNNESAVDVSNRIVAEISSIQEEINLAESVNGPFDLGLLEPLQRMISLQRSLDNYEEVDRLIDRYLQVNRINRNLSSFHQLPALVEQISNDINQEDWQSINDRFQFITWIFAQHSNFDTEDLLSLLDEFASWNLTAVYIDSPEFRKDHFDAYRAVIENAVEFAEREYSSRSISLVQWWYRAALMEHRGMNIQRTGDELRVGPGAGSPEGALASIRKIRGLMRELGNSEAEGMAVVYEADFLALSNHYSRNRSYGSSDRLYRQAVDLFREGGVSEETIDVFFKQVAIIPLKKFHFTIESAMQEQEPLALRPILGTEIGDDIQYGLEFTAWNESLRFTRRPDRTSLFSGLSTQLHSVLLELTIDKQGNLRNVSSLFSNPDNVRDRAFARDAVEELLFRPNPTANRWRSESRLAMLLYRYTP